jgi:hypothetical protein
VLRFLADENFNNDIVRGLLRRRPDFDIVRVQEVDLGGADDPAVLDWAAQEGRILLTHDVNTVTKFAYERVTAGLAMSGVIEVRRNIPLSVVIEDLLLIAEASSPEEWENGVGYLPL